MEKDIDFETVQHVADALDWPAEKLAQDKRLSACFTALFHNSPHSGREKPAMILARLALAEKLLRTLHRHEIDEFIADNPDFALDLLKAMQGVDGVQGAFDTLERRCRKAISDGGPKRL